MFMCKSSLLCQFGIGLVSFCLCCWMSACARSRGVRGISTVRVLVSYGCLHVGLCDLFVLK